jgi:hypothetical protein
MKKVEERKKEMEMKNRRMIIRIKKMELMEERNGLEE